MKRQTAPLSRSRGPDWRSLVREYLSQPGWPALDRWLSGRLRADKLPLDREKAVWSAVGGFFRAGQAAVWSLTPKELREKLKDQPLTEKKLKAKLLEALEVQLPGGGDWRLAAGLPPWLWHEAEDRVKRTGQVFSADREKRLWIRPNVPEKIAELSELLAAEGLVLHQENGHWWATGSKGLMETKAFQAGLFEIQDLGSQKLGEVLPLAPGDRIWDVCAGRGGKTLQLAARLGSKGAVWATDIAAEKLDQLRLRVKRAGFQTVRTLAWNGAQVPDFGPEVKNGQFDAVFLDVPCSGSGTWSSDPEGAFRLDKTGLTNLLNTQKSLLETGWGRLKSGGYLLYATCSWLVSENERQVERFLAGKDAGIVETGLVGPDSGSNHHYYYCLIQKNGV